MESAPGWPDWICFARACRVVNPRVESTSRMGTWIWPISPTWEISPLPARRCRNVWAAMYWRSAGELIDWRYGSNCSRRSRFERFRGADRVTHAH